jgi:hypothetical protein
MRALDPAYPLPLWGPDVRSLPDRDARLGQILQERPDLELLVVIN